MPGISINVANPYNVSDYVPIYGKYCGPGWTGGERNGNNYTITPIDAIDKACRIHDMKYADAAATSNPADAARIIYNADLDLLRSASSLLAENMRPGTPIEHKLDAAGIAYTQIAIDAFSVKVLTIDAANVIKGEVQNILKGLSDSIRSKGGVPVSYQDQFGTKETLTLDSDGDFRLTANTTLDDGSTLSSEAVSSPYKDGAGQVGVVTRDDGSVDVVANGDGETVLVANADVYVALDSTVAIDLPGNTVYGAGNDEINVYTNNTSIIANGSDINFCYTDGFGDYVSGNDNTVDFYYMSGGFSYSPGMINKNGGIDSRMLGFDFAELGDAGTADAGNSSRKIDLRSTHHVSVKVSSATPVSIEHLIQSIAAFGNRESGIVDGFSFTNTLVSDPIQLQTQHTTRMLAPTH